MSSKYDFAAYFDFTGGQNSEAAPDNLRDDEMRSITNFDIILRGALKGRAGTTATNWGFTASPATMRIDRLVEYPRITGELQYLVLSGGVLYKKGSLTPIISGVGVHLDYTVYQDKCYILLNNKYYVYDGTILAEVAKVGVADNNLTEIAKCKYITAKGEKIYAAGNPDSPTALYYSQVGDPSYFKTGDFRVFANSGDGDAISGLHEYQSTLLVFKAKGLWKYEGVSAAVDAQFTKLSADTGTRAYRTIQNIGNFVFFLGSDGVYAIKTTQTGVVITEKVSGSISDAFVGVTYPALWHEASAVAGIYKGKYIIAYSRDKENPMINTDIYVCHTDIGLARNVTPWTKYAGIGISAMLVSVAGDLYMGSDALQEIFSFDSTNLTDRGARINYSLASKDYELNSPIHLKKIKRGWLIFRQYEAFESNVSMNLVVDYDNKSVGVVYNSEGSTGLSASESLIWDKGLYGVHRWGWIDTVTLPFRIGSKGIRIRIEMGAYSDSTFLNEIFIYGFAFMYKSKKPYK